MTLVYLGCWLVNLNTQFYSAVIKPKPEKVLIAYSPPPFRRHPCPFSSVIGESNIEQFLNFVRTSNNPKKKPIAEIAPNYEAAITSLVQMLESRFVNMHFMT